MSTKADAVCNAFSEVIYWTRAAAIADMRQMDQGESRRLETAMREFNEALRIALTTPSTDANTAEAKSS